MTKTYIFPDGKKAVFEHDHNGVGKITLECMDMLMGQLIAYKRCIQSRSFWDAKHCDGCIFYDDCPFDPREDEDEPNCSEKPNNCEYAENPSGDVWECGCFLDTYCEYQIYDRNPDGTINIVECGYEPKTEPTISKMEQVDEPQTDCAWR